MDVLASFRHGWVLALLVIPARKLGDRGLFDAERFTFVPAVSA